MIAVTARRLVMAACAYLLAVIATSAAIVMAEMIVDGWLETLVRFTAGFPAYWAGRSVWDWSKP